MIWPSWPKATAVGIANVAAPVLLRLAESQLNEGGIHEKEKDSAKHKKT